MHMENDTMAIVHTVFRICPCDRRERERPLAWGGAGGRTDRIKRSEGWSVPVNCADRYRKLTGSYSGPRKSANSHLKATAAQEKHTTFSTIRRHTLYARPYRRHSYRRAAEGVATLQPSVGGRTSKS